MSGARREVAERRGRRAEWLAMTWLALKGFQIIDRRFKAAGGEIDIAARRRQLLVFAEVKARSSVEEAILAVSPKNKRRVEAAGRAFLVQRPHLAKYGLRYDIIAVTGLRVRHIADAWREGETGGA